MAQNAWIDRLATLYELQAKKDSHRNPAVWAKDVLGEDMWSMQTTICDSVENNRFTAVQSCHAAGKSFLASRLSAWWIATTPMDQVFLVTTAPTARQVSSILWRYIQRAHNLAKERGYPLPGQILSSPIPSWKINGELVGIGQKPPDKEDSAFQGFHAEKILVVIDEACHDDQTDVLTEHGWMRFADLTGTERLLTMDPETHEARYTVPAALVKRPYKGPMHVYQARGMDYSVTPDHTMLYGQRQPWKKDKPLDWRKAQAGDIATWENKFVKKDITWTAPEDPDLSDDWLAFLGWFGSEGSIDKRVTTVKITQLPGAQQDEIFDICTRLGLNPKIYGDIQVTINDSKLARYLEQWGRTQLERRVPDPVRFASARQIGIYLDAYSTGDGYHKGNGREIIYTSSPRMADDLQELILKTGVPSVVTKRKLAGQSNVMPDGHIATSTVDGYVVSRPANGTHARMRNKNARVEEYDGMVYCATMPRDNLLFTRRNGYTMWSGNCGVDRSIWDAVDSLVTNEASRVLAIGNPTDPGSHFRSVCSTESPLGEKWNKIRIDALRSPLMTEEACSKYPKLVEYMQEEGIPFSTEEVSSTLQKTLVGPTWVYESMIGWGKDSSLFRSKVRALFPETSSEGVIPLAWAEAAMARWERWRDGTYILDPDTEEPLCLEEPRAQQPGEIVIGADISDGGEDETVAAVRQGDVVRELIAFPSKDPLTTADDLQQIAALHGAPTNAKYIVDGIGVGSGVVAKLRRDNQDTYAFIAAANSGRKDTTGKMTFVNDRAAAWWNLRELLNPARQGGATIAFPRDDKLLAELTCPRYDTQPGTPKYKIEKKDDIRTRLGRSTDRADALIHAYWMPYGPVPVEAPKDHDWKDAEERYPHNDDPYSDAVVEKWDTDSDMEFAGW